MIRYKEILGCLVVSFALAGGCNCGKKGKDGANAPGGAGGAGAALDPTKASAEAKAEFEKVVKRYETAKSRGKLSASQCEDLSKSFKKVYKKYGKQMTIAWFNSGAVWEECGETEKAEEIYQSITKAVPKYDLAYNNLGVIYWNRKQEGRALEFFNKAVKANPKTKAPRNNLAAALRDKYAHKPSPPDFDKAEHELQSVLAVDSSNRLAYENLARLYYDRGRLADKSYLLLANLVVTQATRVLKEDLGVESADIANIKGLLFMERDNQVDALRAFKKAAELEPNHADAHMNIAMISLRFRDYQQAAKSINIALKDRRQKRNIETYLGLGVAQRGLRKYGEAEKAFKKAGDVKKSDPRPLYNLGILYQEHLAANSDGDGKKENETAKGYFNKFIGKAGSNSKYSAAVADAKQRITNIDDYFKALAEMRELEKKAKELEALQKKQEAEEKKRLLDLEEKARKAAAAAATPKKEEPKKEDPKKDAGKKK